MTHPKLCGFVQGTTQRTLGDAELYLLHAGLTWQWDEGGSVAVAQCSSILQDSVPVAETDQSIVLWFIKRKLLPIIIEAKWHGAVKWAQTWVQQVTPWQGSRGRFQWELEDLDSQVPVHSRLSLLLLLPLAAKIVNLDVSSLLRF